MAPQVQKARTAFMFYQRDQLQKIRQEMGANASMGEAMTEVRGPRLLVLMFSIHTDTQSGCIDLTPLW
jgi:hypothetical protein